MPLRILILLVIVCGATGLWGHHSFAATYAEDHKITIHGNVVQFYFRNPHSFLMVETKGAKGEASRWMVEWDSGGQLGRIGITRETLRPGDQLSIVGNPARNPTDHRIRMSSVTRVSDSWKWSANE